MPLIINDKISQSHRLFIAIKRSLLPNNIIMFPNITVIIQRDFFNAFFDINLLSTMIDNPNVKNTIAGNIYSFIDFKASIKYVKLFV